MNMNLLVPTVGTLCYFSYPTQLRISETLLYVVSVFHNSVLILFSGWTFVSLLNVIYKNGVVVQSNYYFADSHFDKIIFYFYLSKYYEYVDTFLLYLNGKQPILLQKYHHIGATFVWHLSYYYKVDAIWIATISNSFVHTIMYSYYLGCLLKIKQVRVIKKYITSLQLVQLIVPNFIILYFYSPPVETAENFRIICVFIAYVSILIVLFGQFYYKSYVNVKPIKQKVF